MMINMRDFKMNMIAAMLHLLVDIRSDQQNWHHFITYPYQNVYTTYYNIVLVECIQSASI